MSVWGPVVAFKVFGIAPWQHPPQGGNLLLAPSAPVRMGYMQVSVAPAAIRFEA
jgi:hypothetical protein